MIVQKVLGQLSTLDVNGRGHETILLEWYETNKKLLHKKTSGGKEIIIKRLSETVPLKQDDVVYVDKQKIVSIKINPCEVISIYPKDLYEMASVCYEIGNKHLPLFYEAGILLVPFEKPLYHLLLGAGFKAERSVQKLLHPLKTTVAPHGTQDGSGSLFSRIMQLTAPKTNG